MSPPVLILGVGAISVLVTGEAIIYVLELDVPAEGSFVLREGAIDDFELYGGAT
jgi:hypothetical protein